MTTQILLQLFDTFTRGDSCILDAWQLSLSLSKVKLQEWLQILFAEAVFVSRSSAAHSSAGLDDPSPSSLTNLDVMLLVF